MTSRYKDKISVEIRLSSTVLSVDKLIDTIHLEFRDRYKNELRDGTLWLNGCDFDSGENILQLKFSCLKYYVYLNIIICQVYV